MNVLEKKGGFVKATLSKPEIERLVRREMRRRIGDMRKISWDKSHGVTVECDIGTIPEDPPVDTRRTCYTDNCGAKFANREQLKQHQRLHHGLCGEDVCGYGPCERPLGHDDNGHQYLGFGTVGEMEK